MDDNFFRLLNKKEEKKFRQWVRDNVSVMETYDKEEKLGVLHPVVRDEWRKMKQVLAPVLLPAT